MKAPGPDHPITIKPNAHRVRVAVGGQVIADTSAAVTLQEAAYAPVLYLPREDVDMARLEQSSRSTHCPYKGDAVYFSIRAGDRFLEDAVWSYEQPYPAVNAIANRLAFYPDRVEISEA